MTSRKFNFEAWLKSWLRKGSYRVPEVYTEVKRRARISRGLYKCSKCKQQKFRNGEFAIDHIRPVIDPKVGFIDWNTYISRLFCGPDLLQLLCHPCHDKKTKTENTKRRIRRLHRIP